MTFGGLWVAVTAVMASAELKQARADSSQLREQLTDVDARTATASAEGIAHHARRAHDLTRGPAWAVMSRIPVLGDPFQSARGIAAAADELGRNALPQLVAASAELNPETLRAPDGTIDLQGVRQTGPAIEQARRSIGRALAMTHQVPTATWLTSVDAARADVLDQLQSIEQLAAAGTRAARLLPPMLGADRPMTYLLALQNNAEARGTGGLSGAFAIVTADQGRLSFDRFEDGTALVNTSAAVSLGQDYRNLYRNAATTRLYGNANLSPHFPYAAQIWRSMWQRKTGQNIDGVVAVDPQALAYVLAATGPAKLVDGTSVTAANVVRLTQNSAYLRFAATRTVERKAFLLGVAQAVADKISKAPYNGTELARGLARAASERRLLAWSADPALQQGLEASPLSGSVPYTAAPYVGMTIINEGGNKLDYYLDRSVTWHRTGCGSDRTVTVTASLKNNAPAGLPTDYLAARSDNPLHPVDPGDHRVTLAYAATTGALMTSVTIDGEPVGASMGFERGHPVFTVDVELPRGRSRTVVLHLWEPAAPGAPIILRQPLVRPLSVAVRDEGC